MSEIPNFPPGPKGPEDHTPGAAVAMTAEQARYIGKYVAQCEGASSVVVADRGAGYYDLDIYDRDMKQIDSRPIHPHANRLPNGELA